MTVTFFNYFTRYAEAVRLPVEPWALEGRGRPDPGAPREAARRVDQRRRDRPPRRPGPANDQAAQAQRLGLGMANSQRAMLRAPGSPGVARVRHGCGEKAVGRDIELQVSFAVSMANQCRYCTLHQVLGLRRLGVDPGS